MNVIALASLLFALLVSACVNGNERKAEELPFDVEMKARYADKLAGDPKLAKHVKHFISAYSSTDLVVTNCAYVAISSGEALSNLYNLVNDRLLNEAPSSTIVRKMKLMHDALVTHLSMYSKVWSTAIEGKQDFTLLLATTQKEFLRMKVFSKIDSLKNQFKNNLSGYEKTKYPKTYELYAILSQFIDLAKEPKGSLMTFNSTTNDLRNDFSKTLALAELEF